MQPTSSKNPNLAMLPALQMRPRPDLKAAAALAARGVYAPPYPWEVPPPAHIPRHIMGSVPAPVYDVANQVEVLTYTVPANMNLVIAGILFRYDGQNFVQGSGDVVMSIDIDNPTTGVGTGFSVGRSVPDYGKLLFNLGSFDNGPWPLLNRPIFYANQRIGFKVYTVQNVATLAPNRVNAMFIGWEWPVSQ